MSAYGGSSSFVASPESEAVLMARGKAKSRAAARAGSVQAPPGLRDVESIQERTRGYQMEMFQESLRRNIIVAMDTGSGKTHIAVLRMQAELDKGNGKLCWFLVPNVALGSQQYEVLKGSLPPIKMEFLSGIDKVDKWSDQEIWDGVLGLTNGESAVIISTHQVLLDALTHGFVKIEKIGLLIFDEAHHCVNYHPANRIMQGFYHHRFRVGLEVPTILGLTASPVVRAKPDQLRTIEANLNAIARTPVLHRKELLDHVYPPKLRRIIYTSPEIYEFVAFSQLINTKIEKLGINVTDPGAESDGSSEFDDSQIRFQMDPGQFESIDPRTGEPYTSEDFEIIDPITGDTVRSGSQSRNARLPPVTDDYEIIDPITGESYIPSPEYQETPITDSRHSPPQKPNNFQERSSAFESLRLAYFEMDILEDPYILALRNSENPDAPRIKKLIDTKNTFSQNQMKGLVSKATHIRKEYGSWATEWYIKEALRRSLKGAEGSDGEGALMEWNGDEKKYLRGILKKVLVPTDIGPIEGRLADKVEKLIEVLLEEYSDEEEEEGFAGLVFVEQRVEVTILQQILKKDNRTKDIFRSGTIVGAGQGSARVGKGIYELITAKNHIGVIEGFRSGKVNLLISTSVVEEGLDIPACHLVVCFSLPQNLKSFIQRRGRARRAKSTYVLMFEEGDREGSVENFEKREKEMIAEYLDENRELTSSPEAEGGDDEGILGEGKNRRFLIESTGACLTLDSAVSHLHHFSDCLPSGQYMNLNPVFTCEVVSSDVLTGGTKTKSTQATILYRAEVLLPNCIPPEARQTSSKEAWPTEKWAKRDAAFEAYIALYNLKLVDDHLMPLLRTDADEEVMKDIEKRPSKVPVDNTMNPWEEMKWDQDTVIYSTPIRLSMPNASEVEINMLTSVECPPVDPIAVYWSNKDIGEVTIGNSRCLGVDRDIVEQGKKTSYALLSSLFGTRMKEGVAEFPYLFTPKENGDWDTSNDGVLVNALHSYMESGPTEDVIINDEIQNNLQYIIRRWRTDIKPLDDAGIVERYGKKAIMPDQPVIEAVKITKRRDFLHPEANQVASENTVLLLPQYCSFRKIPWRFSQLALFLPGIIRRIEISLIASDLQRTLLAPVGIKSTSLVVTSLCTSAAREATDYQRFEFLGDSVLKFLTSVNLVDEHPLWHEGYLALKKDRLVSNGRLAKAAQDKKLARWIITQIFTGVRWAPHYIQHNEDQPKEEKNGKDLHLSTKILADVVESLIGAAFIEGGYEKALKCINLFIPENNLKPLHIRLESMFMRAGASSAVPASNLRDLETLIGYEFRHKALLVEAITHPSYISDMNTVSYQRLEFLGDALLDLLVVPELFHYEKNLSHIDMHLFKASVVNAHFLAFLSLGFSMTVEDVDVKKKNRRSEYELGTKERKVELWKFMRHQHAEMTTAQKACWQRYDGGGFRDTIKTALDSSADYPWTALYGLEADKFFSDIVEALLGAIFVDSGGDFGPVTGFAERLGVFKTMWRVVKDKVDVTHPVKKLGELVAANGQATVEYIPGTAKGKHCCTVLVNGKFIVKIDDGSSWAEARVRAAETAYDQLRKQNPNMRRKPSKPSESPPSP